MKQFIKGIIIVVIMIILVSEIYKRTRFYYYDPIFQPFSQRLQVDHLTLKVGDTYKLRPQSLNKRVSYKSSNFRIVDVMPSGKIIAKAVGTAIITATGHKYRAQCKVTVVGISAHNINLQVGEHARLSIKGSGKKVTWESNSKIVSVDEDGLVTALLPGLATITATISGKRLQCNVYIKKIPDTRTN